MVNVWVKLALPTLWLRQRKQFGAFFAPSKRKTYFFFYQSVRLLSVLVDVVAGMWVADCR